MALSNYLNATDLTKKAKKEDIVGPTLPSKTQSASASPYESERQTALKDKMSYYDTQEKALDADKARQQEMASITLDKLQKYLPYQIKAQGLSGTGASESTMLQAHTNYMNTMADIANNYNTQKNELARYEEADLDAINEKYDAKRDAASNTAYNNLLTQVERKVGRYTDDDEEDGLMSEAERQAVIDYVNTHGDNLTEADKQSLLSYVESYDVRSKDAQDKVVAANTAVENKANTVTLSSASNAANSGYGDNFEVSVGDETFEVEKGNDVTDDATEKAITEAFGGSPSIGSTVVYNGKIYMFLENNDTGESRWCTIQGRELSDASFRKLCTALGIGAYSREKNAVVTMPLSRSAWA